MGQYDDIYCASTERKLQQLALDLNLKINNLNCLIQKLSTQVNLPCISCIDGSLVIPSLKNAFALSTDNNGIVKNNPNIYSKTEIDNIINIINNDITQIQSQLSTLSESIITIEDNIDIIQGNINSIINDISIINSTLIDLQNQINDSIANAIIISNNYTDSKVIYPQFSNLIFSI